MNTQQEEKLPFFPYSQGERIKIHTKSGREISATLIDYSDEGILIKTDEGENIILKYQD